MSLLRLLQRSRPPLSLRPAPSACYATAALKQPKLTKTTQLRADRSSVVRPVSSPDGQAIAFSTAERYNIDALRRNLWDQGLLGRGDGKDAMNLMGEAIWIPTWPVPAPTASESQEQTSHEKIQSSERVGEIFVFESGSIVAWNMAQADAQSFIDQVISSTSPNSSSGVIALPSLLVEREKYNEVQTEAMDFIVRYGERTGVRDDLIVIGRTENGDGEGMHQAEEEDERRSHRKAATPPLATAIEPLPTSKATTSSARKAASSPSAPVTSPSPDMMPLTPLHSPSSQLPRGEDDLRARLSLSSGLARSTKLAMYEEMLESYMDEVSSVPAALSSGSDAPLHKRDIVRNTGNLLLIRQGLNLNEQNLIDPPEMFWSNAPLEAWYKEMIKALEVPLRLKNLNVKLDYSLQIQSTLQELESTKVSHRLEWIIIILIAAEISLVIIREGIPGLSFSKEHKLSHESTLPTIASQPGLSLTDDKKA